MNTLMPSSSNIAVSVRGLSKRYTLAHNAPQHTLASEALLHSLKNLGKKPAAEDFWALKDVSFDIHKGDVVGHHRPERGGQVHPPESPVPHYRTHRRAD